MFPSLNYQIKCISQYNPSRGAQVKMNRAEIKHLTKDACCNPRISSNGAYVLMK